MNILHTLTKPMWLTAALSVAVLFSGCETTPSEEGATSTGDSANVRQAKIRSAEGGSSSPWTLVGTKRSTGGTDTAEVSTISTDAETVYEDHLVKLEKVYKSGSTVGQDYNYDIIVTAKRAVTNVEVDEFLPDSIKYKSATPAASMNQFGMPSWDLEAFDAGDKETINVVVTPTKVGEYKVCSVVRADPLVCLPIFVGQPELKITKTGPAKVELGENAVWDIMVTNTGNAIADNVVINDTMPSGFSAVGPITKNVGDLDPGQSADFKVTGKSNQVGKFTNTAVANFDGGTPVQATAPVEVVQSSVAITKTGPKQGYIFVNETYNITVTNKGNTTLNNLVITDNLPDGAVLVGKVADSGEVADIDTGKTVFMNPQYLPNRAVHGYWRPGSENPLADDTADQVQWKLASLAPGASKTYTVAFHANSPMTTVNKATVVTDRGLTDSDTAETVWKAVPGVHTSLMDDPDPIQVGETTTYTIKALNQSRYDTFTVTSQEVTIPDGLTIVSAEGGTISGNKVTYLPTSLGPRKEVSRTIVVKGAKSGSHTTVMETMTNFRTTPVVDQESTKVY